MEKSLKVKGMHCHSCERLLTMAIEDLYNVSVKSISYEKGEVEIEYEDEAQIEKVKKIIKENGYEVVS